MRPTAEFAFNRLQERDRARAVAVVEAVLEVAQFNDEIELSGIEEVDRLAHLRHRVRIDADRIFLRNRARGARAVVDVRNPAEGGNQVLCGRERDLRFGRRGGRSRTDDGRSSKETGSGLEEQATLHFLGFSTFGNSVPDSLAIALCFPGALHRFRPTSCILKSARDASIKRS